MKQKLIPIVSIIVGVIAFLMTFQYIRSERRKLDAEWEDFNRKTKQIRVMVAKNNIPSGTAIKRGDLGTDMVPKASVGERAVLPQDAPKIFNKKALFNIKRWDPVLWTDVEGTGIGGMGLAARVNKEKHLRAISVSVGGAAAVSGMVRPNDRVDIIGTFSFPSRTVEGQMETVTLTVLQDVTVLATGQTLANAPTPSGRSRRDSGYSTVTLEVSPREAEVLVFAQQVRGRLVLSLRNPADVYYEEELPEIDFQYLEKELPKLNEDRQRRIRGK